MDATDSGKTVKPPYLSYATFKTFIESLADLGVPDTVDKSAMGKVSGTVKAQLSPALRFLGLIDANDRPLDGQLHALVEVVHDERLWKHGLRAVVERSYGLILSGINVQSATLAGLKSAFEKAEAGEGSTLAKAVRFYVAAAKDAGIPISPHIVTRGVGGTRRSGRTRSNNPEGGNGGGESRDPTAERRQAIVVGGEDRGFISLPRQYTAADCDAAIKALKFLKSVAPKATPPKE